MNESATTPPDMPLSGRATRPDLPCPKCGTKGMTLSWGLTAKPIGTFSLSGAQLKLSAIEGAVARCPSCGATWHGKLQDPVLTADGKGFVSGKFVDGRYAGQESSNA